MPESHQIAVLSILCT